MFRHATRELRTRLASCGLRVGERSRTAGARACVRRSFPLPQERGRARPPPSPHERCAVGQLPFACGGGARSQQCWRRRRQRLGRTRPGPRGGGLRPLRECRSSESAGITEEEVGRFNDRTLVSAQYLTISCTDPGAEGLVGCAAPRCVQRRLKRADWLRIDLKRALGAFGWSVEKTTEVYPRPNAGFPARSTPQVARSSLFWPNWRGAKVPAPLPSAVALVGTTSGIAVSTIGDRNTTSGDRNTGSLPTSSNDST